MEIDGLRSSKFKNSDHIVSQKNFVLPGLPDVYWYAHVQSLQKERRPRYRSSFGWIWLGVTSILQKAWTGINTDEKRTQNVSKYACRKLKKHLFWRNKSQHMHLGSLEAKIKAWLQSEGKTRVLLCNWNDLCLHYICQQPPDNSIQSFLQILTKRLSDLQIGSLTQNRNVFISWD